MHDVFQQISKLGIVPVIKIDDAEKAVPLAKALIAGGLPCAEITFRTAQGDEAIRRITSEVPGILVGAGTVTTIQQVDKAIAAGSKFIVSPGLNPKIVKHCIEKGIPVTPGCSCPSDIEQAMELGLDVVKFFPAEQSGGLEYIKAVSAAYSSVRFMPTGGINGSNLCKYLSFDPIIACGGSWMVSPELLGADSFDEITRLTRQAVYTMLGFELAHIGINTENEQQATQAAGIFQSLFGFAVKNGASSVFADQSIEFMKSPYLGKNGHIAISVNSVSRAVAFLERMGARFNADSAKKNPAGMTTAIYLQEEIAGFAVHLRQKR